MFFLWSAWGGSIFAFQLGAKGWPYGAHGYSTPSASNCNQKRCKNASASVKLNYRSLPVGPQRGKDDRREYVRGGVLHGG